QAVVGMSDPLGFRGVLRDCAEKKQQSRAEGVSFRTAGQQSFTVDMTLLPMPIDDGAGRVRIAIHDVTWRAAAEQSLRFLSQAGARLGRIPLGSSGLLDEIAAAGTFGTIDGCWVELEGDETAAWRSDPLRRKMTGEALELLRLQIEASIREARTSGEVALGRWVDEIGPRPQWAVVRSWVTAPVRVGGQIKGTVTLFQPMVPEFEESARRMTEEFAHRVSMLLENDGLYRRVQEATRAREEIIAILAHDLSIALFSFRLHAQRGLMRGGEQAQRALGVVARGSQWLLGLVKTVLDLTGMEKGGVKVQPQQGNLAQVLESACLLQKMDAEERRLEVVRAWPDELSLEFDQERILQVVFNLVNNALKFTPPGGRLVVGAAQEGEGIHVWVQDSGRGLDPGQLERVFERGWQADPKAGGKGLGLYISRRIVEAHGGSIFVESTLGHGATFHVVLPSRPATVQEAAVAAAPGVR
ncbi:MAG TPA: GAF domain-containing sensor histidine kinase, partial [Myxococcaceae bacterium]|nr:GAF domain-containing sensor histidine kinase [Myxococcaceae bacterium]